MGSPRSQYVIYPDFPSLISSFKRWTNRFAPRNDQKTTTSFQSALTNAQSTIQICDSSSNNSQCTEYTSQKISWINPGWVVFFTTKCCGNFDFHEMLKPKGFSKFYPSVFNQSNCVLEDPPLTIYIRICNVFPSHVWWNPMVFLRWYPPWFPTFSWLQTVAGKPYLNP